jgi:hypothetical protein
MVFSSTKSSVTTANDTNSIRTQRKMPIHTGLQPKINNAPSSRGRPPCASCEMKFTKHSIETFVVNTEGHDQIPSVTREDLCGNCLVGHDVAVLRSSDNGWCFGEVKEYNASRLNPFLIVFNDEKEEWVDISPTPSKDYLNFIVGELQRSSPIAKTMDQSSIGTFFSSSMSSTSSYLDTDHAFPLFDDENLMHLHSFSSLDDSIDDEVSPKQRDSKNSTLLKDSDSEVKKKKPTLRSSVMLWTLDEDQNLQTIVETFAKSGRSLKWTEVAKFCGNRNGKQCRERYVNHLSATLKVSPWCPEEDTTLFMSFFRFGKSWCKIAKVLRGR